MGGTEGGREEAMMLGSQRASVEEGRVDAGNEGEGLSEETREQGSKVGKLQGRYPEEGTGQHTVYSHPFPQRCPCHWYFVITNEKIVNRYKL